jgi:hypothetical protein
MTPDDFIFSSDDDVNRGRLNVVRRATPDQTKAPIACVFVPAMPENMTIHDGQLLLSFESGTKRYEHDHPVNHITHLHKVVLNSLLAITDPVALAAETAITSLPGVPALPLPAVPLPAATAPQEIQTAAPTAAPEDGVVNSTVHVSDAYVSYLTALFDSYVAHLPGATATPAPTPDSIPGGVGVPASMIAPDSESHPAAIPTPIPTAAAITLPSASPSVSESASAPESTAATSEISSDSEPFSDERDASGSVRFSDAGDTRSFEPSSTTR